MLFKEVEDCDICPIREEGLCKVGKFNPSSDCAYEPICEDFDPDEDTDVIIAGIYEAHRHYEEMEDRRIKIEREKVAQKQEAQKRRRESNAHVRAENREIKRLRKKISANEAIMRFASSMTLAMNFTNEAFGYKERVESEQENTLTLENKQYLERILELQAVKTQKLKELRKSRIQKNSQRKGKS